MFRRSNNVREEHGRETAVAPLAGARSAREKALDFGRQRLDIADPRDPVVARQFHEPSTGDLRCERAARLDLLDPVTGSMEDQRRRSDRRKNIADVRVLRVAHPRLGGRGRRAQPRVRDPVFELLRIVEHRRTHPIRRCARSTNGSPTLGECSQLTISHCASSHAHGKSSLGSCAADELHSTSFATRSGRVAAKSKASLQPSQIPNNVVRGEPTASRTTSKSSRVVSMGGGAAEPSESPQPRSLPQDQSREARETGEERGHRGVLPRVLDVRQVAGDEE